MIWDVLIGGDVFRVLIRNSVLHKRNEASELGGCKAKTLTRCLLTQHSISHYNGPPRTMSSFGCNSLWEVVASWWFGLWVNLVSLFALFLEYFTTSFQLEEFGSKVSKRFGVKGQRHSDIYGV